MRFLSAFVAASFSFVAIGCNKANENEAARAPAAVDAAVVERVPDPPHVKDAKVLAFKASIGKFVEEARSVVRAADLSPSRDAFARRLEVLTDVYSRIPEPPHGDTALDAARKAARQVTANFGAAKVFLQFGDDALRLGSREEFARCMKSFHDTAEEQSAAINKIEAALSKAP